MIWLALCVLVVVVGALAAIFLTRRPRQEKGVTDFRRHIDALSPEARREVQDRVRDQNDDPADPAADDEPDDPDH